MKLSSLTTALSGALLLCSFAVMPSRAAVAQERSIDQFAWHQRLLIMFADTRHSASFKKQRSIAANAVADFSVRDLVFIQVVGDSVQGASDSADAIRHRYGVPANTFRALLIGKDGGIKLDSRQPIPLHQLFSTIDAMPMRQDEMNTR